MNFQQTKQDFVHQLETIYDMDEAINIAVWVLESVTGFSRQEQPFQHAYMFTDIQVAQIDRYLTELLQHRPVQYVLGECYFWDLKLFVDESVLIPRPETEELVDWALKFCKANHITTPAITDIGTGSACIPLSLKKHLPKAQVSAVDISEKALEVARRNARDTGLDVTFFLKDILDKNTWDTLPACDIIISNPPYITLPEKESILPNVLQYEPHEALFVTNEDPQQFYKAIEAFARLKLNKGGAVFLELHRDFARETADYYRSKNWKTELRKDMQGNDRMLLAQL